MLYHADSAYDNVSRINLSTNALSADDKNKRFHQSAIYTNTTVWQGNYGKPIIVRCNKRLQQAYCASVVVAERLILIGYSSSAVGGVTQYERRST